ncbi:MAG: TetR/AcrR family transcriptional regulator [Verrucomicrobia bacterium]|nr:TetR/AcrR family transcriptional regulator [Verrucomicrobiota bacterium]
MRGALPTKTRKLKGTARDPARTQERILVAALHEFAARGFAGARVDCIARRARINKRMLYHYFGDKDGLFREVLRRKIAQRAAWVSSSPDDPGESLPYWFDLARQDIDWIRLLEWEALQVGNGRVMDEEARRKASAVAVDNISRRQGSGHLSGELDPRHLLLAMISLTTYALAFPQVARLITGLSPDSPKFCKERTEFLRRLGATLRPVNCSAHRNSNPGN